MKNQKGFVLPILIIVSLLILAVVAYFFSPKSISVKLPNSSPTVSFEPTTNWKTYTNGKYGFSFSYPKELQYIYEGVPGGDGSQPVVLFNVQLQNFDGTKSKSKSDTSFQFTVLVKKALHKTLDEDIPSNVPEKSKSLVVIDGRESIKVIDDAYANWPTIWTKDGDYIYLLQLSNSGTINEKWFDQIISTFKFVE
jgi:hypothetical protein